MAFLTVLRRLYSVVPLAAQCAEHPEKFNAVNTKFGWVLVPKTHVARGWTQPRLNEYLSEHSTDGNPTLDQIQLLADSWVANTSSSEKPATRKRTQVDIQHDEDLKLYLQQLREELAQKVGIRARRVKKDMTTNDVTFTHAWNYFMTQKYPVYKRTRTEAEARALVGNEWRSMSMDEKDVYREEYLALIQLGKDILHGAIVDRDVKLKAVERLNLSKEKSLQRKLQKAEEAEQLLKEGKF